MNENPYQSPPGDTPSKSARSNQSPRISVWSQFFLVMGILLSIGSFKALAKIPANPSERVGYLIAVIGTPTICFVAAYAMRRRVNRN